MNNTRFSLTVIFLMLLSGNVCAMKFQCMFEGRIQTPEGYVLVELFKKFGLEDFEKKTLIVGHLGDHSFFDEEIRDHFKIQCERHLKFSGMNLREVEEKFNKLLEHIRQDQGVIIARKRAREKARGIFYGKN